MLEDEFEFAYTTVCPRCGFEIGYDDFPPNECPDCGLSINMSRPTTGAVDGALVCGKFTWRGETEYIHDPECPDHPPRH